MESDRLKGEPLDTLGDDQARQILAEIVRRPASVRELTGRLDMSRATIYRRIEKLQEYGLVEERTLVADEGNHYSEYRSDFSGMIVSLDGEEYDVRVVRDEGDVLEQFEQP